MASLRDTVKDYQEELRDGIAWVAFWKTGRSWNAEYFHLEMSDILYPEDRSRMEEIKQADPAAVVVNGYYSGYLGEDMSLDELTAGVRHHYENGYSNIGEFIEAHDDRLPPELIEEARAAAHAAGLPFSEKAYRDGEEPDPYLFDGSMSMEDYELMHRMIEKERSEHMEQPILSGYLSNLGKYTEGRPAGEWVSFPTTAEHLKEVFDRIGILLLFPMRRSAPCRWAHFAFYRRFFKEIFAFVRRLKKSSVLSREKGRYYRLSAERR